MPRPRLLPLALAGVLLLPALARAAPPGCWQPWAGCVPACIADSRGRADVLAGKCERACAPVQARCEFAAAVPPLLLRRGPAKPLPRRARVPVAASAPGNEPR